MAAKSQKDPTIYLVINFLVLLPFVFRDWDTQYHYTVSTSSTNKKKGYHASSNIIVRG